MEESNNKVVDIWQYSIDSKFLFSKIPYTCDEILERKAYKRKRQNELEYYSIRLDGIISDLNRDQDPVIVNFRNECEKFLEYLKTKGAGN